MPKADEVGRRHAGVAKVWRCFALPCQASVMRVGALDTAGPGAWGGQVWENADG